MRRAITALAAGALIGALAGPALAFDSGGTPTTTGPDSITWTGQGATDGALDSTKCGLEADPGQTGSYLHWIFTTDGGSVDASDTPVLYLGGTAYVADKDSGGAFHFVTPYYEPDPTVLSAVATFTVTATGRGGWILTLSHGCDTTVADDPDLTVTTTAVPTFTRTYAWTIAKAADKTRVVQVGGGTATFDYAVTAGQTGVADGDWTVTGSITVHNPNVSDIALTGVTAAVGNGGACSVSGDTTQVVPANGGSSGLAYACTYAVRPDPLADTVAATATWDETLAGTPTGSASGTGDFAFGAPTDLVNPTATFTDSYAGTLGTLTATDAAPYASATYTYSRTVDVPTWDCLTYDNTATIAETGQEASVTVRACGPMRTGALTMGFWQNRNGQAIIAGAAAPGGVCAAGTWLRGYAPFTDLQSGVSCSKVAAYVTTVVKAANASGASMNAMLKGQLLATALDVYFSDPALGGNLIGAGAPLGGVSVDLTTICTDLTCTAYEDSSAAFGGSPKTVAEMLAYASTAPTYAGATWYGNLKTTQELAKDAFDALNNQKAFAP